MVFPSDRYHNRLKSFDYEILKCVTIVDRKDASDFFLFLAISRYTIIRYRAYDVSTTSNEILFVKISLNR